jgi:hypothetical protein
MRIPNSLALLAMLVAAPVVRAADLTKIDRTLAVEPAYLSKLPKYCLLVFGPDAKTRVWLILDGRELYLDRDGKGDLSAPGNRIGAKFNGKWLDFPAGFIHMADGTTREFELRIRDFDHASGKCTGMTIIFDRTRRQYVGFDEANPFRFGQRPEEAPIVHVDGPLTFKLFGEPPTLVAGQEVELNVSIGTPGVGAGSFCAIRCCTVLDCRVSPVAELELPHRHPNHERLNLRIPIPDD